MSTLICPYKKNAINYNQQYNSHFLLLQNCFPAVSNGLSVSHLIPVLTDRPPPIIRQGPSNQTLGVDSVALLKCQASGDPIPSISWLKDGVSLLGKDPRMSLQELGSLQMRSLRVRTTGATAWSSHKENQIK